MQYAEQLLEKYSKVARLAERGAQGEKENATRLREKMQSKYPGIDYQSQVREREQADKERAASDAKGAGMSNGNFGQGNRWSRWGAMAESAFSWATEVAGEVANVDYARRCAEKLVEVQTKNLSSAKLQIAAKITLKDMYSMAYHLNPTQKQVFAQMVGAKVAEAVLKALEEDY